MKRWILWFRWVLRKGKDPVGTWIRFHLGQGHEIRPAPGGDRFIFTCSCGATYLIRE